VLSKGLRLREPPQASRGAPGLDPARRRPSAASRPRRRRGRLLLSEGLRRTRTRPHRRSCPEALGRLFAGICEAEASGAPGACSRLHTFVQSPQSSSLLRQNCPTRPMPALFAPIIGIGAIFSSTNLVRRFQRHGNGRPPPISRGLATRAKPSRWKPHPPAPSAFAAFLPGNLLAATADQEKWDRKTGSREGLGWTRNRHRRVH
jgi:hypothetical protein